MKYLKNLSIIMGIMIGIILVSTFLMTTLNYFNVFGKSFVSILPLKVGLRWLSETIISLLLDVTILYIFLFGNTA